MAMRQAKAQDEREEKLKKMMAEYQQPLLRMCCIYLHDYALAEDAVQETFLKAYKHMDTFRGDCSQKSWLTRIAMNTCKDLLRTGWFRHVDRATPIENVPAPDCLPSPAQLDLVNALFTLPLKDMEILLLTCYQNLTITEAAQIIGMNRRTATAHLQRSKERLRLKLEGGKKNEG